MRHVIRASRSGALPTRSGGDGDAVATVEDILGVHTEAVHSLLSPLEAVGFRGAPRALGFDEQGREELEWIAQRAKSLPRETRSLVIAGSSRLAAAGFVLVTR